MAAKTAPKGLGDAGRKLWRSIADPVKGWDLRPDELAILDRACRVTDLLAELDEQLEELGSFTTTGSMGQLVEHPILTARARNDALLQKLLSALKLPDLETGQSSTSASARKAAQARWSRPQRAVAAASG